jgi:hypothetical protein
MLSLAPIIVSITTEQKLRVTKENMEGPNEGMKERGNKHTKKWIKMLTKVNA